MTTVVPITTGESKESAPAAEAAKPTIEEQDAQPSQPPLPDMFKVWTPTMITDKGLESEGWQLHAGGFFKNYQDDTKLCVASSICPCLVAALNASQLQEDLEHDPKWMLQVAVMYMFNPCSVGSAIREDVWKQATTTTGIRPGSLTHKKSFCTKNAFFCLPHCCCCGVCCCAVAQDRRALLSAQKSIDKKKVYKPTFRADALIGGGKEKILDGGGSGGAAKPGRRGAVLLVEKD